MRSSGAAGGPARVRRLAGAAPARAEPASATVVERILAVVEGAPVLLSEVALAGAAARRPASEALEALIDERLMFREAVAPGPDGAHRRRRRSAPSGACAANARRRRHRGAELRRLARRQAAILKYVEFRFRPQVRVDDEAVRRAWEARTPADVAAARGRGARPTSRRLAARELDARIEAWVKELRAGAEVRYNP